MACIGQSDESVARIFYGVLLALVPGCHTISRQIIIVPPSDAGIMACERWLVGYEGRGLTIGALLGDIRGVVAARCQRRPLLLSGVSQLPEIDI